jgi:AcrR family transcriptional regulator
MGTAHRILHAAWRRYARDGEAGVTIRKVADAVDLSAMAIYRHYPSRDALLAALTAASFEIWETRVRAIRARTARAWLTAAGEAYLAFALDEPHRFAACFELPSRGVRRYPSAFAAGQSPAVALIAAQVARGLAAGELAGADALTIALILWSQAHGLIRLYRDGRFDSAAAFRRSYRRCLRLVFGAFVPAAPGGRR